ncbi:MAG: hypothetical protein WB816_09310 [Methylocystis sp.]
MAEDHELHIEINVFVRTKEVERVVLCRREFEKIIPLAESRNATPSYFNYLCEDSLKALREEAEDLETLIIGGSL